MKRFALYIGLATAILASCSTQEKDSQTPQQEDVIYYASFEQPAEDGTRVYANEDLLLRWTADDRVSIFGKNTYNQQYKFLGETGDNAGGFNRVDNAEFVTGNPISHVVSVYPYQASTKISEEEVVSLTLPAEQHYAENSFGLGANTMVSVSEDDVLQYKNVGGYLMLKLYGQGVSVSSITLKGNNGEKLAGKATVSMPLDGVPTAVMADDATDEITLICDTPVALGATAEESTQFWFVVPPVTFSKGFTITVFATDGDCEKSTGKTMTIERNKLAKMAPIEVELPPTQPRNVIYYTSSDGAVVTPRNDDNQFGANILSNEYMDGLGVITFDGDVMSIGHNAFSSRTSLTSITIPDSVTSIGDYAFNNCTSLTSFTIPDSVTSIGIWAFHYCSSLSSITIPDNVTCIENYVFYNCLSLASITIPDSVTSIGKYAFCNCTSLISITIPDSVTSIGGTAFFDCWSLTSITIPDGVTKIEDYTFYRCTSLTSITIPDSVMSIGHNAFRECISLTSITIPDSVTSIGNTAFGGCTSLTSITIPDSVTSIGDYAFGGCTSLTSITIPDSVTSIGDSAFCGCSSLNGITVESGVPPTGGQYMFDDTNYCPIYVPDGSRKDYKSARYWSDYADRIQAIFSLPVSVSGAVDMGLPSGLKWASFNLGASKPEEYGDYYAWGEAEPYYSSLEPLVWKEGKEAGYNWASYKWCTGSYNTLTKYCDDSSYGDNGFTDSKTVLDSEDDAAHVKWEGSWRMPTDAELIELQKECDWEWTSFNDINGYIVTGPNGNKIFFPAAGRTWNSTTATNGVGSRGFYWSSSRHTQNQDQACYTYFESNSVSWDCGARCLGFPIRPVCD